MDKPIGPDARLHPEVTKLLRTLAEAGIKPVEQLDVAAARQQSEMLAALRNSDPRPVGYVDDRVIETPAGPLPARFYWPDGASPEMGGALPVIVYYHGGGHVIGSIRTHDGVARMLCADVEALVISVDYRMGPEHRFPAAAEDAIAALHWAHAHAAELGADPERIAVAGDSAGGNLALVAAIAARDAGGPPLRLQLLVYPVADYALAGASYETFATGYGGLQRAGMHWFRDHYLNGAADIADWRASPIRADLRGLAPALIIAADCDVLFDDGVRLEAALRAAGVVTDYVRFNGMIHGFFGMAPAISTAGLAQTVAVAALRRAFA